MKKKQKSLRDKAGLESYGLWLLSQRDMSRHSVRQKFVLVAQDAGDIDPVLDKLEEYDYLNDQRFAEVYTRICRESRGYGPIKTKLKLKEKGIDDKLISRFVKEKDTTWHQLAYEARERKFGSQPLDYDDRNKQTRFLISRGFTFDHVKSAFSTEPPE
ncbi:MAG: regulatory protein RecX [Hafnia sp.]